MVYNIVTYFKEKNEIDPYIVSFAYVVRLLETANGIIKLNLPVLSEENESLKASVNRLDSIRKNAWFVFSGNKYNTSSNPLEILADYLKMVFHVDIIQFNRMLHKLSAGYSETDNLIGTAGYLETAIAIGSFRASLKQGWCMPDIDYSGTGDKNAPNGIDGILSFSNLYHPLLTDAVKNNIETSGNKGVLITGSNASGKSTFLRSVALNIVLAQSVNTCTADKYTAPQCMPVSSMSLKDNLMSGESYYMAEIKSVKRILDMAAGLGLYVVCFIDEVLRGTNTVERIAASTEILKKLSDSGVTCFAATHDIELTRLLENSFDNYHFEEEIAEGDIHFPYKLLEGKSSCSNAILLLEIMGYDRSITDKARTLAEHFLENGRWEMLD
jgi:DNA mismatch repair ATPase MutS